MTEVIWKPVPEFPDYEISSLGAIRRVTDSRTFKAGYVLTPVLHHSGYLIIGLRNTGKKRMRSVHQLVCEAFHGPKPSPRHQAAHYDGNRANPAADNLRWATATENNADMVRHGTRCTGAKNPRAKLTERDVLDIRRKRAGGEKMERIARSYGVHGSAIQKIVYGKNWRCLNA